MNTLYKKKCEECNKRIKSVLPTPCKCDKYFCGIHKINTFHNCTYDYIGAFRKELIKKNPCLKKDKFEKI